MSKISGVFIYFHNPDISNKMHVTAIASMIVSKHFHCFKQKCFMRLLLNCAANGYFSFSGASHKHGGCFDQSECDS